jgi:hypothetical protein
MLNECANIRKYNIPTNSTEHPLPNSTSPLGFEVLDALLKYCTAPLPQTKYLSCQPTTRPSLVYVLRSQPLRSGILWGEELEELDRGVVLEPTDR